MLSLPARVALLSALTVLSCAAAVTQDAAAIAEVASGKRAEAKASWWGFDPSDSTAALQAAIRSGARKVIVENLGSPWIVDKIRLASDQEIVFESGVVVQAKRGAFHGANDSLFLADACTNLTLTGPGATFQMWKQDYTTPEYTRSEWRNTITLRSCTNVRITGLTLAESGGDGIYLGARLPGEPNRQVEIRDVTFRAHHRQGISVISAEDLLVENCALLDTAGTAPQSGIDFEPNHPEDRLVRCVVRNCRSANNRGMGYQFSLDHLRQSTQPLSVRIENCVASGCTQSVYFATGNGESGAVSGSVEFVDCRFEGAEREAIFVRRKPATGCKLQFTRCALVNPAANEPTVSPIGFATAQADSEDIGGVRFLDCTLAEPNDRPLFSFVDTAGSLGLVDVTGELRVDRGGKTTTVQLTPALLAKWFPAPTIRKFPKVEVDVAKLQPAFANRTAKNWAVPVRLRDTGTWLAWAEAGTDVAVTIHVQPVGRKELQKIPMRVISPDGEEVPVKRAGTLSDCELTFRATRAGAYRITCQPGTLTAELSRATVPVCLFSDAGPMHLLGTTGQFRFWVPAGTRSFGVKLAGGGGTERIKAAVLDPAGNLVEEKDNIERAEQIAVDLPAPSPGAAWTLRLARPTQGVIEDFTVQLQGIPMLLSAVPEALLRPAP